MSSLLDRLNSRIGAGPDDSAPYEDPTQLFHAGPDDRQPLGVISPPAAAAPAPPTAIARTNPQPNKLWTDYSYYTADNPQTRQDIDNAYMNVLGRARQPDDYQYFGMTSAQYYPLLQATEEAKNYAGQRASTGGPTSSAGPAGSQPMGGGDAQSIIRRWQQTHSPSEPLTGLIEELKRNGINADAFMYGSTPSGNEITLNGQQYKVKTGDNNAWWDPSQGEGGGGGGEFNDPWGSTMESLTRDYIASLGQNPNRSALDAYVADLMATRAASKQRAQEFAGSMGERVQQLRGPAFDEQQIAALRTGATDALERRRQQTLKNEREKIYLRGFEPTSGIATGSDQEINRNFEQSRTGIESDLLRSEIDATRENQRYADQLEALVQQALAGGDITSIQAAAAAADVENKRQQDDLARQRERIAATQGPLGLIASRLAGANQTLSLSSPNGATSSALQLLNLLNGSNSSNRANNNEDMAGLAQLLDLLLGD